MIFSLAAKMNKRLLLIAAVLATVSLLVSGQADFAFYKFGLHWPPSVCNDPDGYECKPNVLNDFYIHGLWPHYANGQRVPPYNPDTNRCTDVDPVYPDQIVGKLDSIRDYLIKLWPNFRDYENRQANENFWKYEWKLHGMCSDYPDNPYMYFRSGLFLGTIYSNPLNGTNIIPRFAPYQAKEIIEALKDKFGVYPEIGCNQLKGMLQLREIHLCFERDTVNPPSVLQDCPSRYTGKCKYDSDRVRFTPHLIGG